MMPNQRRTCPFTVLGECKTREEGERENIKIRNKRGLSANEGFRGGGFQKKEKKKKSVITALGAMNGGKRFKLLFVFKFWVN